VDRDLYKATIARRLFELAKDLGVSVVAEGFKAEEQWRWILAQGADYAQGYFLPGPTPLVLKPARVS
jgi:EAL domain-containing protein (putative c-di-GMP-specific phosphodiesterase class I)